MKRFNEGARLSFPLLSDKDGTVTSLYNVIRHPHTVIIDRRGSIVGRADGERDWAGSLVREWLTGLLEGSS